MSIGKEILDDAFQASLNEIWKTAKPYSFIEGEIQYFQNITAIIQSVLGTRESEDIQTYKSKIYLPVDFSVSVTEAAELLLEESINSVMDISPIHQIMSSGPVVQDGITKFSILVRYYN